MISPFVHTGNICCGNIFCVRATTNVSEPSQKHFVAAANVSCACKRGNIVAETFYAMFPDLWWSFLFVSWETMCLHCNKCCSAVRANRETFKETDNVSNVSTTQGGTPDFK